ncbi:MAG TPA: mycofactocin biosynthesis glycosyltransferase MftF [Acidimicrobiales bacterium]|nr:mycofactocin biosynthesis glycosyltransferase MftF [Acidimicrobiales bacterium]
MTFPPGTSPPPDGHDAGFPEGFAIVLAADTRVTDGGRVLIGGSPIRILRLTPSGAEVVRRWSGPEGGPVPGAAAATRLARRLLDAGMAHPRPGHPRLGAADVTVVIPVRDQPGPLTQLLDGLTGHPDRPDIVIVDDGSADSGAVARIAGRFGARLLRLEASLGPGAARNRGWKTATTAAIAFLDADCSVVGPWLDGLLGHLNDPCVALCAPRVVAVRGDAPGWLAAYETFRSPLDLGPVEAPVRPRGRVAYLPAAALLARRSALEAIGGYDESLSVGEDVDLVWRLVSAGWVVRYEPAVEVGHICRPSITSWLAQRVRYGTSAAALDQRHPGAVAPLTVGGWSALSWGLAGVGLPRLAAAVATGTTLALPRRLRGLEHPWREGLRLAGFGHLAAGRVVADAVRRAWWPPALVAGAVSRRMRRGVMAAAVLPPLLEWATGQRPLDPARWAALRLADDLAYGTGVWWGSARCGRWGALRPDLANWPGRSPAVERLDWRGPQPGT